MKQLIAIMFCLLSAAWSVVAAEKETPAATPPPAAKMPAAASVTAVVARVNGREIKRQELDAAMRGLMMELAQRGQSPPPNQLARFEHDVLEELIGRELILEEGRKQKLADLDAKVAQEMGQLATQLGGEENVTKGLQEAGLTKEKYAERVRDNLIVQTTLQRLVESQAAVTPEEVKAFYDKNPEKFQQPETVHASHILIRVPAEASADEKKGKRAQIDAARTRLTNGEKFAEVAKQVSEDPGSATNGGDLGYFPRGAMVPEFDIAAFKLKTNEVSEVVSTPFGYHILMVTDHKPAHQLAFEEVKVRLGDSLKNKKGMEIARKHVAELRTAAKVEVLLAALPAEPAPAAK